MNKYLRGVLLALCLVVFLVSGYCVFRTLHGYQQGRDTYEDLAGTYAAEASGAESPPAASRTPREAPQPDDASGTEAEAVLTPPITVDFDALRAVCPEVVGWIYSEGTVINYPVVQGTDNSYYLKHLIDGTYNKDGSIFVDAGNRPGFADGNTIVYGHNMKDGMMFAELLHYADQSYYEAHPVLWLLTPEGNYQIVLYAGYTTNGTSDTYTIFEEPGEALDAYSAQRIALSDFISGVTPGPAERQVVLSTCAYSSDNARYVVHGVLRPCG